MSVLNNSRTEALEKAFGDSDKAEVLSFRRARGIFVRQRFSFNYSVDFV